MQFQLLLTLLVIFLANSTGLTAGTNSILDQINYKNQVVASIGNDRNIAEAVQFLLNKHATVLNYNLECNWSPATSSFVFQGESANHARDIEWDASKIQIVAQGSAQDNSIGGLVPNRMAQEIKRLTNGNGAKIIEFVSCNREGEIGIVTEVEPTYLGPFMNEMIRLSVPIAEVSIRSSLVAVNSKGELLTGEVVMESAGIQESQRIKWSSNSQALKWIGKVVTDSNGGKSVAITKSLATQGQDNIETKYVGILGEGTKVYMTLQQQTLIIDDNNAFRMLDAASKQLYQSGSVDERATGNRYRVSIYDSNTNAFTSKEATLREFSQGELVKEIRYQAAHFTKTNTGEELYRFGDLVVRMDLSNFNVQVAGLIETTISSNDMATLKQKWTNFPLDYKDMHQRSSPHFFEDINNWISGRNNDIHLTRDNFEELVYTAQSGMGIFVSESIRCFHNHFTNMMALDMAKANLLNKELFIAKNVHPMIRAGTWPDRIGTGVTLLDRMQVGNTEQQKQYREIKKRLSCVTKSWLSHVQTNAASGSQDIPPQSSVQQLGSSEGNVKVFIDHIGTVLPDSHSNLRDYEQQFSNKLISTQLSMPEMGLMESQSLALYTTKEASGSLKASLALTSDHAYVVKAISDAIKTDEIKMNKRYEMVSDSIEILEGRYIKFSVFDKDNPSTPNRLILANVDVSKLSSSELLEDMLKQTDDSNAELSTRRTRSASPQQGITPKIKAGVTIFGVVQGIQGAFSNFEEGNYGDGIVGLAQSLHGVGEVTQINQKIWRASKNVLKTALKGALTKLTATAAFQSAERMIASKITGVVGKLSKGFLKDIPIIGTAFAVYSIVEDFERHSVIGYIDAGLDILTAGLSFLGPEAEPFVIALTFVRMGIDTFYNNIGDELKALPDDATILDKVVAVFKGIGDSVVDIAKEYTLIGQIIGAVQNSKKLDKKYEEQQRFLSTLTDYSNYYQIASQSGSPLINFAAGSRSQYGGGIKFNLGDSGTSELTIEIFDANHHLTSTKTIINTPGVEDMTLGIGQSHSYTFKTERVKFLMFTVKSRQLISEDVADTHSLFGEYTGNSRANGFYAIQNLPDDANLQYSLSDYYYKLHGGDGDDFFYLGPQTTHAEGNEGSDTYYITSKTTTTTIFNFAEDLKADYLLLYLNYHDIRAKRQGQDVILTSSDESDGHLVIIEFYLVGERYQHLIIRTQDGLMCTISATEIDKHLELTPYAFDAKDYKTGADFNGEEPIMSHVSVITGSSLNDNLNGNTLNNQINGNGGSDTLIGHNGKDVYILIDNEGTHSVINNYATDEKVDILSVCARNKNDVELVSSNQDLVIRSHSCNSDVYVSKWFSDVQYRHLMLALADGEMLSISDTGNTPKLQIVMIDLAFQSERDIHLEMTRFGYDLGPSSPTTGTSTYVVKNGIDLRSPQFKKVVTVMGSDQTDWIVGNSQNNYMSAGKGSDYLYGVEGFDVYVIKKGDGSNTIFQQFSGDTNIDTIIFDANYNDIELVYENDIFSFHAYKSSPNFLEVALRCLHSAERQSENAYHMDVSDRSCVPLNELYYVRSRDGVVFKLPTSRDAPMVKTPLLVDYSKENRALTTRFTKGLTSVKRFIGSKFRDSILANSFNNYIDPGVGGSFMEGKEGSDTYVIQPDYGTDNGIYNDASDYSLDTLLFMVPFDSISAEVSGPNVVLSSTGSSGKVSVSLYDFTTNDANRHLVVVTADGITFALPESKHYSPTALIINRSQMNAGQYINLISTPAFSEVKTVYGSETFQNHIIGNNDKNTVIGGTQADLLEGLDGDDVLKGGAGNDKINGGSGQDTLVGGPDDDMLIGGDGDDILSPGLGFDEVHGGRGMDTVIYSEIGGIEAFLPDNVIHYPHDTIKDRIYGVESVFGTRHNDILQGDNEDNILMGNDGDDKLYTGKKGSDILIGGNGSDTYSWIRPEMAFTSDIDATMIVDNYARDEQMDTILHDITVRVRSDLGFEKSKDDLVIRKISTQYPVFYDNGPVIILKNWFHSEHQEHYRHIQLRLRDETLDCSTLEAIGEQAARREQHNILTVG